MPVQAIFEIGDKKFFASVAALHLMTHCACAAMDAKNFFVSISNIA